MMTESAALRLVMDRVWVTLYTWVVYMSRVADLQTEFDLLVRLVEKLVADAMTDIDYPQEPIVKSIMEGVLGMHAAGHLVKALRNISTDDLISEDFADWLTVELEVDEALYESPLGEQPPNVRTETNEE